MAKSKTNMHTYRTVNTQKRYRYTQTRPAPQRRRPWRALGMVFIALALFGGYHIHPFSFGRPPAEANKASAAGTPVLSSSQVRTMAAQINAVIAAHPGMEIGVAIKDLNTGSNYHYGLSDPFIAASISKLLTACLFLHQVETGQDNLNETVNDQTAQQELQAMIEQSDNDAWVALNSILTHDRLQNYAQSIGLSNYDPDNNSLTVDDISLLLSKIYKRELLNSADTKLLLSYMHSANEDDFIVDSVPGNVKVYHKAGWLEDRVHDAAIIDNGLHPYTLVIFTKDDSGIYDSEQGHQIFADITGATTQAFLKS